MRKMFLIFILVSILPIVANAINYFPMKNITVGSYCSKKSPEFRELRYLEQIPVCNRRVYRSLKNRVYAAYNVGTSDRALYTVDHYIPLFMGGSNDFNNLWPQPKINTSARFEQKIYTMLKKGRITVSEAIWFMRDRKDKK